MIPARRDGSCWYPSDNHGRIHTQIAAQRWIAELVETGRITRGQKMLLEELAKFVDAKRTTQKSIAYLAKRCGVRDRTVQRYLRGLAPSKAKDPEAWSARVLTRRFIHAAPDSSRVRDPGRGADNVPSWFTLEIPERFFTPKPPPQKAPRPRPAPSPRLSPGGVEIVTQAVIIGSGSTEISATLHPCSNLAGSKPRAATPPTPSPPEPPRKEAAPPPQPPPVGGDLPVQVCAKLFPSHAPLAHRAVQRLAALGWSEGQIVTYLRKASKDPGLAPGNARHPLLTAVWLAEKQYRSPPSVPKRPSSQAPPGPSAEPPIARPSSGGTDPKLLERIELARRALSDVEVRTGVRRPRSVADLPPSLRRDVPGTTEPDDPTMGRKRPT
jgi:hypothetical protein